MATDKPTFNNIDEAYDWMYDTLHEDDELCIDNERFAYVDDEAAMLLYNDQAEHGCCACFESLIIVDGREAIIGCNYGH